MAARDVVLTRRSVLVGASAGVAAVMLAACSKGTGGGGASSGSNAATASSAVGSAKQPLPKPASFSESPAFAAQVKAGKLPKIEDRLPEQPYVVPHNWVQRGKYGGTMGTTVSSTSADGSVGEWFYGFSLLRYFNDGQDLGPGLVEKWSSNADTSSWTFTLRKGLKWSDGHPATTADILFWWNDMVQYADYPQTPPDECKSGKGTVCTLKAADDYTFTMDYDAPAPLTADRIAMWSNGPGGNGPTWIVPAHFAKQYHKKYNPKVPNDWSATLFPNKVSYRLNPACPTMTGFRLATFIDGKSLTWEPNPYSYAVTRDGDQLPYLDKFVMREVDDPQVTKLQATTGKLDICYGAFAGLGLADVSTLMKNADSANVDVVLWDSGSGTGSLMFLCQDYYEEKYRKLFRDKRFRQALSHAFNRAEARKAIYFEQGEVTTGTQSPKAIEYLASDEGKKMYTDWRDAYVAYDTKKANDLLDALGLTKRDGSGFRTFPDGSKLAIRLEISATADDEHKQKDAQLVRDWKGVDINASIVPVPPTTFGDVWTRGQYMSTSAWEASDGPNQLLNPAWLVPLEPTRWAPLQGAMYNAIGTKAFNQELDVNAWKRHPPRLMPEKGGPIDKLWTIYDQSKIEVDPLKRQQLVFEIIKVHISDGPFYQGTVANTPRVIVVNRDLRNVPRRENLALHGYVNTWILPVPASYDPETFYWDDPTKHNVAG